MGMDAVSVEKLMTPAVVTTTADTAIASAANTLRTENIGSLVVLDSDERLVGVLTRTDFVEIVAENELPSGATVADYMSDSVETITPQESITDAAATMMSKQIHHLPVTDGEGDVLGMLSTTDLTGYLTMTHTTGVD